jgi:hypothetical protein
MIYHFCIPFSSLLHVVCNESWGAGQATISPEIYFEPPAIVQKPRPNNVLTTLFQLCHQTHSEASSLIYGKATLHLVTDPQQDAARCNTRYKLSTLYAPFVQEIFVERGLPTHFYLGRIKDWIGSICRALSSNYQHLKKLTIAIPTLHRASRDNDDHKFLDEYLDFFGSNNKTKEYEQRVRFLIQIVEQMKPNRSFLPCLQLELRDPLHLTSWRYDYRTDDEKQTLKGEFSEAFERVKKANAKKQGQGKARVTKV